MQKNVDLYFVDGCGRCSLYATPACKVNTWAAELQLLRGIMLNAGLIETIKWGCPCYVNQDNKNIAMVVAFKQHPAANVDTTCILPAQNNQPPAQHASKSLSQKS